jgi:hypothetical protein
MLLVVVVVDSSTLAGLDPITISSGDLLLNTLKIGVGGLIPKVAFKIRSGMEPTDSDMPIS